MKPVQTKAPHTTCTVILPWQYRRKQWNKNCLFLESTLQICVILHLLSSSAFSSAKSCKIGGRWLCSIENVAMVSKEQKNFKISSGQVEMLVKKDILLLQQHLQVWDGLCCVFLGVRKCSWGCDRYQLRVNKGHKRGICCLGCSLYVLVVLLAALLFSSTWYRHTWNESLQPLQCDLWNAVL